METHQKIIQKESFIFFKVNATLQQFIFVVLLLFCTTIFVSPPIALVLGLIVANLFGHPFLELNHKATNYLLQFSVVGLGFGMNVHSAVAAGKEGFLFTIISIMSTLVLGTFLGKWFKTEKITSHLISCGTAICGGSAIAAIAPVIKSNEKTNLNCLGCNIHSEFGCTICISCLGSLVGFITERVWIMVRHCNS